MKSWCLTCREKPQTVDSDSSDRETDVNTKNKVETKMESEARTQENQENIPASGKPLASFFPVESKEKKGKVIPDNFLHNTLYVCLLSVDVEQHSTCIVSLIIEYFHLENSADKINSITFHGNLSLCALKFMIINIDVISLSLKTDVNV